MVTDKLKIKRMKYIFKSFNPVLLMLLSVFCSCENFLDEHVYSLETPSNFYENADEARGAMLGIISTYSGNFNYQLLNMEEYTTDNVVIDAGRLLKKDDNLQFSEKDVRSTNALIQSVYSKLYKGIYNCNAFIYNMKNTKWATDDNLRYQFIAEAYTLRALNYFKLVRLWGAVPLIINIADNKPDGPVRIGRTPVSNIYAQIVNDLRTAKSLYQQEEPRAPGYASKILARLVLADVYLTMSGKPLELGPAYLAAARAEADTLIHARTPGIKVPELKDFYTLFSVANENRGGIIFSGQNYGIGTGQIWPTSGYSYGALSFDLIEAFDTSGPVDVTSPNVALRNINPNTDAYDITKHTDPVDFIDGRFYPTFWPYRGKWNAKNRTLPAFYNVLDYGTDPASYSSGAVNRTVFPGKLRSDYEYKGGTGAAYPHYDKKANVIMYRWAEAYLIYAEADNELNGPQPGAVAAVNIIRRRAGLAGLPAGRTGTKESFRKAIRSEWRLEFVDEGKRFYNLKRWGILIDKVNSMVNEWNSYNPTQLMHLLQKGKNEVYPIPFQEIDLTHFPQNPEY